MSADNIEIRPLSVAELELVRSLFRADHQNGEKMVRYLDWRLEAPAPLPRPTVWGAMRDGSLLGTVTTMPLAGPHGARACWYFDTLVAPEARGLGLAKKLVKAAAVGWDYVMAKGSSDVMYHVRRSIGFLDVGNDSYRVRYIGVRSGQHSLRTLVAHTALAVAGSAISALSFSGGGRAVEVAPDVLKEVSSVPQLIGLSEEKSSQYLWWRYGQCPGRPYTILSVSTKGGSAIFVVLRRRGSNPRQWWIVDMIFPQGRMESSTAALKATVAWVRAQGGSEVRTFASADMIQSPLRRAGFMSTMWGPRFTWYSSVGAPRPAQFDFWHGDADNECYVD